VREANDVLDMELINSLPQPFMAIEHNEKWQWPIHDVDVQTGCMRIDVCGLLQPCHLLDYKFIEDSDGKRHEPESFYFD